MTVITIELIAKIKKHYKLRWMGKHGVIHWNRVYDNGIKLSTQKGVDSAVVQLFSIFHDSQRKNEHRDPKHGFRGGQLAIKLRNYLPIDDNQLHVLTTACTLHTDTQDHENITIQACFDSDRLDLGRVGIYPDPDLLCTPLAKKSETIEWAYRRSRDQHELPEKPFGLEDEENI